MATTLEFPTGSLTAGQLHTIGDKTWEWTGTGWKLVTGARTTLQSNLQTGTTYTLVAADAGRRVDMANASANTLTVPPNASVAIPVDTVVFVSQGGAGATTIAAGAGVTINTNEGLKVGGQYRMVSLLKTGTNTWLAAGTVA